MYAYQHIVIAFAIIGAVAVHPLYKRRSNKEFWMTIVHKYIAWFML